MKNKRYIPLLVGILLLSMFVAAALFPSLFTRYALKEMFEAWLKPCEEHILGTNALGYDIFTELVYGARETIFIGLLSSVFTLFLGVSIGTLSTCGGLLGAIFNGLINIFVLLPKLISLIVLSSFFAGSEWSIIILISAFSWVGTARNVRAKVIHIKQQPFIENCIIQGYSAIHITVFHIIPNLSDILMSRLLLGINSCIMMESSLSFLGFGNLYYPTWGTMVNFAFKRGAFIRKAYGYLLMPGICIMLLSLSFYFISLYIEKKKETISE